jgi:hypothetical protein
LVAIPLPLSDVNKWLTQKYKGGEGIKNGVWHLQEPDCHYCERIATECDWHPGLARWIVVAKRTGPSLDNKEQWPKHRQDITIMLDERSVDRTQLIVCIQVAVDASVAIFELHLKRG